MPSPASDPAADERLVAEIGLASLRLTLDWMKEHGQWFEWDDTPLDPLDRLCSPPLSVAEAESQPGDCG